MGKSPEHGRSILMALWSDIVLSRHLAQVGDFRHECLQQGIWKDG
jgi:hypothetical protein